MATYILQNKFNSRDFDKDQPYYVIEAQGGLNGIEKEAYNKVPNGYYTVYTKNGKKFGSVSISEEFRAKPLSSPPSFRKHPSSTGMSWIWTGQKNGSKAPIN